MTPLVMTDAALAVVLGGALGFGVCLLLSLAPRWGAPTLARRIAPYLRDITDPRGLTPAHAIRTIDPRSLWNAAAERAGHALGGSLSVERRLRQAGRSTDAASFRARQLGWAVAGVGAGGAAVVLLVLAGRGSGALVLLPPLIGLRRRPALYDFALSRAASGEDRAHRGRAAHGARVPRSVPFGGGGHPRLAAAGLARWERAS